MFQAEGVMGAKAERCDRIWTCQGMTVSLEPKNHNENPGP